MAIKEYFRNYAKEAKPLGIHPNITISIARRKFDETFIVGLANAYYENLPTPEEVEYGGYETRLSINRVEKHASVKITHELMERINNLK